MSPFIVATLFFLTAKFIAADWFNSPSYDPYHIEFHVYHRERPSSPDILVYGNETQLARIHFKNKPNETVLYIHGWLETARSEGSEEIRNAYLQFTDYNVILVDWSSKSMSEYFMFASPSVPIIGKRIARMLKWLKKRNRIDIKTLHVIGFSLGGHIAGFMGKALAPEKVRRITGLDPACPNFEGEPSDKRLDKSDAEFVDIIHTNTNMLGISAPIGHADFYPDGGTKQFKCSILNILCSHTSAYKFYVKSVSNPSQFRAKHCDLDYQTIKNCHQNRYTTMGHGANPNVNGVFYVNIH